MYTAYAVQDDINEREIGFRAFMLYVIGNVLLANSHSKVRLGYLASLIQIDEIGSYDWGGAAYRFDYVFGLGGLVKRQYTDYWARVSIGDASTPTYRGVNVDFVGASGLKEDVGISHRWGQPLIAHHILHCHKLRQVGQDVVAELTKPLEREGVDMRVAALHAIVKFHNLQADNTLKFAMLFSCQLILIWYGFMPYSSQWNLYASTSLRGICYGVQFSVMVPIASKPFGFKHFGVIYNFILLGSPLGAHFSFQVGLLGACMIKRQQSSKGLICLVQV
ncbi:hypothetical protein IFM89_002114 [Coptis chinensis]|uniref:Aminotransferase-like plant mobile domain-containing protein n=1 Tax=Coptis chinensis TaxID=261450 RepID=A0A835LGQ4_9MAGN|nr:hypothetical protein IFM89_002114 [Coptis chinensis]